MKLSTLLFELEYRIVQGSVDTEVTSVVCDTRAQIEKGACFVCISGTKFDSHDFAGAAAKAGASVIISEKDVEVQEGVTVIRVQNTRRALALVSAAFLGNPSRKLKIVGITGTKGKTTTAYMVRRILQAAGHKTDLVGTVEITIGGESIAASHTTPESYVLQDYLARMVKAGTEYVVMEVSSQGLKMDRVAGISFAAGIFTNLEPDHIAPGEHPDFADYLYCKSLLFRQCKVGIGNRDSEHFDEIFKNATCPVVSFGIEKAADSVAKNIVLVNKKSELGVDFDIEYKGEKTHLYADIPGAFNAYNALAAFTCARELGISAEVAAEALKDIKARGRVELVKVSDRFSVMLDYAHNGMSLKSLLTTLREYEPKRLVCMFGCGGNRAKDRRYDMGEVSSRYADLTVVTSDNPRFEEPMDIINDILTGVKKADGEYVVVPDRREAVKWCLEHAKDGDMIVIAGKGHEDYQEIKGVKYPMDDRKMILEAAHELNLC
ncbi:MAG: UDP-N-acetylmuramoyl-L-alanyl-D-glutamate--2,6-diaminopimelate ligase [Lachnospiraceae bacterium]|nr:UDP-N-acetylmuramoyl-L-alanyl-D-glutamate--2,6-diaminopimelate ligase [Lachnospiraceae bacterium]MBP5184066.1 UDP-N-acetylmuramoyl-L-alanyl-D-glutamate--2,6-diaminopimelate ligase [Lachnospiraceae bacterium]